jgi:hypothetical protein
MPEVPRLLASRLSRQPPVEVLAAFMQRIEGGRPEEAEALLDLGAALLAEIDAAIRINNEVLRGLRGAGEARRILECRRELNAAKVSLHRAMALVAARWADGHAATGTSPKD